MEWFIIFRESWGKSGKINKEVEKSLGYFKVKWVSWMIEIEFYWNKVG